MPPDRQAFGRIFVEEIEQGSWADACGISSGNELVACNGELVSQMKPQTLLTRMKMRPLQLSFAGALVPAGTATRGDRSSATPGKQPHNRNGETAVASTIPDTSESSVSFVEDSYMLTPSAIASASRSRV